MLTSVLFLVWPHKLALERMCGLNIRNMWPFVTQSDRVSVAERAAWSERPGSVS